MSAFLAQALAGFFGQEERSDCTVIFTAPQPESGGDAELASSNAVESRAADGDSGADAPQPSDGECATAAAGIGKRPPQGSCPSEPCGKARKTEQAVGAPLPAHTLVLYNMSSFFRSQLQRWLAERGGDGGADGAACSCCSSSGRRPELRVPLNSADDEPAARAALKFAYTGQVEPTSSVREVLQLRRQAGLLGIEGDPAKACDELLAAKLSGSGVQGAAGCAGSTAALPSEVLEFFNARALHPSPQLDPTHASFSVALQAAQQALVWHFRDALSCLNMPSLEKQLLELQAVALELLLASDSFGTDTEDSVLLLLATWMKANFSSTDAPARERLSKLVRLVQLTGPTLTALLPALAEDYTVGCALTNVDSSRQALPREWLPIRSREAAFIADVAMASEDVRDALVAAAKASKVYDLQSPRYSFTRRPQCVPPVGIKLAWFVERIELEAELAELAPGSELSLPLYMERGVGTAVFARGLCWEPSIGYKLGDAAAGVNLGVIVPYAYRTDGSSLCNDDEVVGVAGIDADVAVHVWADGEQQDAQGVQFHSCDMAAHLGGGCSWNDALPLAVAAAAPPTGAGAAGGAAPNSLAAWASYLGPDGRITGDFALFPPPHGDAGAGGEVNGHGGP